MLFGLLGVCCKDIPFGTIFLCKQSLRNAMWDVSLVFKKVFFPYRNIRRETNWLGPNWQRVLRAEWVSVSIVIILNFVKRLRRKLKLELNNECENRGEDKKG